MREKIRINQVWKENLTLLKYKVDSTSEFYVYLHSHGDPWVEIKIHKKDLPKHFTLQTGDK